jgi:hypothetical protein
MFTVAKLLWNEVHGIAEPVGVFHTDNLNRARLHAMGWSMAENGKFTAQINRGEFGINNIPMIADEGWRNGTQAFAMK